jgi:hypothetical protein
MQRRISKFGRYAVPGLCALALGACFHPAPQEAVAPSGNYGGTVVAYPVGGYGYDGYDGYPGYCQQRLKMAHFQRLKMAHFGVGSPTPEVV